MSRCFPFPPPGYEKKVRIDDPNILKKEKQRVKKTRKEKDKEKRGSKVKNDKDGGDEKHRKKKDKKEKHEEKKKDKKRNKEKEKLSCLDEKRLPSKYEGHQDGERTSNEKRMPGKSEGHNGEKSVPKEKEKDNDRNSNSREKKVPMQFSGRDYSQSNYLAGDTKDSTVVQEMGKRVRDDRGTGNHLPEKFAAVDQRRNERMSTGRLDEGKEKTEERCMGDKERMVWNLVVHTRIEETSKAPEKDSESISDGKEGTKQKQLEGDDKHGDKCKYNSQDTNHQGKDKERYKEKRKEEKVKMKGDYKNIEKDTVKHINKDDHRDTHNTKALHLPKYNVKNALNEANLRKRKGSETNGYCHANDIKPSKLLRSTSSLHSTAGNTKPESTSLSRPMIEINKLPRPKSHSLPGNGKMMPSQMPTLFTSDKSEVANNLKADIIKRMLNGLSAPQPLSVSSIGPKFKAAQTNCNQIAGASVEPPHPDTEYLSQILLVPKMDDCSNLDDQEWLFQDSDSHSKIPKMGSPGNDDMPQVWAEAMRIEAADVCALPYVIPH